VLGGLGHWRSPAALGFDDAGAETSSRREHARQNCRIALPRGARVTPSAHGAQTGAGRSSDLRALRHSPSSSPPDFPADASVSLWGLVPVHRCGAVLGLHQIPFSPGRNRAPAHV